MSKLKVNSLTKELEFKRKHNQLVDEIPEMIENAIKASEDILGQIVIEYDSDNDSTTFNFPKGINPISITFNTHTMFFLNGDLVDYVGNKVEGYEVDDAYVEEGIYRLVLLGNISEQVINDLTYIKFNGNFSQPFSNSYYLFYPDKLPLGTKLYKHILTLDGTGMILDEYSGIDYAGDYGEICIISTSPNQITMPAPEESDIELLAGYDVITIGCCLLSFGTINIFKAGTVKLDINCTNKYLVVENVETIEDTVTLL